METLLMKKAERRARDSPSDPAPRLVPGADARSANIYQVDRRPRDSDHVPFA